MLGAVAVAAPVFSRIRHGASPRLAQLPRNMVKADSDSDSVSDAADGQPPQFESNHHAVVSKLHDRNYCVGYSAISPLSVAPVPMPQQRHRVLYYGANYPRWSKTCGLPNMSKPELELRVQAAQDTVNRLARVDTPPEKLDVYLFPVGYPGPTISLPPRTKKRHGLRDSTPPPPYCRVPHPSGSPFERCSIWLVLKM